ncbi:hypothetical protein [Planotetraspora phitsanulokensis]|uniref:hypothetical protein n=1 Tax=Planotetraspora phitsanulokensis TaxID=575192 RepID=UPI00194E635E|nr:hypothetical protein [Planotetraspora phitsanulokensis]
MIVERRARLVDLVAHIGNRLSSTHVDRQPFHVDGGVRRLARERGRLSGPVGAGYLKLLRLHAQRVAVAEQMPGR